MKVTKEHLRDTRVAIGKGLLQHNATRAELKDIFLHAKSGSIINTCFNDLIAAYEDSPENAMLSAVIQEALTMSTRENTTLRTLLCYHHNADTNKTVRNELARGVPVPRLSTSKENLQFKREKCPGIVSLICLRGGELKLGAFADLDPDDPYTKPVGARRKLLELLFSEVEMYLHFFQYPCRRTRTGSTGSTGCASLTGPTSKMSPSPSPPFTARPWTDTVGPLTIKYRSGRLAQGRAMTWSST